MRVHWEFHIGQKFIPVEPRTMGRWHDLGYEMTFVDISLAVYLPVRCDKGGVVVVVVVAAT